MAGRVRRLKPIALNRGETFGQQLRRIQIDHDLAVFTASRRRESDAVDGRQPLPQIVQPVIIKLLFVEGVRARAATERGLRSLPRRSERSPDRD
jgi:hypothetical protein